MSVVAWRPRVVVIALVACACAGAAGADTPLDLDEALRLAQARSLSLPAHDAAAAASRELAVAAAQRPDPVLKGGLTNLPVDGPQRFSLGRDFMTMVSVGVMQELTRESKLLARSARFERESESAHAARDITLAALRRETATAWLELHFRLRMRALLLALRGETALQVEAADGAYRGGRGAQADLFAARSAVAQIDDRIRLVDSEVTTARTQLTRWLGESGGRLLGAAPDLTRLLWTAGELESALERHPQIAWLARQEAVAEADAEVARRDLRPDWSVELMFNRRGPSTSNMVSLNLSIPWHRDPRQRQDRELSARLSVVEQLRAQREETRREIVAQSRGWLQAWQAGHDRLAHHDKTLIPLAGERGQAALAAYRGGAGPLAAVLDARRAEIDARIERLRIEMDTAGLWARLSHLLPPDAVAPAARENRP